MPMIPETAIAMLACARIGAVHSVVFGGFSPEALKGRIEDCASRIVITADEGVRGGKKIPLKANVDEALKGVRGMKVEHVVVVKHTGGNVAWKDGRDKWYEDVLDGASEVCPAEPMNAEDPLFILYTSGSTGKPKGVLHTTAGYLLHASITHQYVFDYRDGELFWCAADVGWVTGHTLHRLRRARERRDDGHVRRHTDVPRREPALAESSTSTRSTSSTWRRRRSAR